jgi:hypothetical protein
MRAVHGRGLLKIGMVIPLLIFTVAFGREDDAPVRVRISPARESYIVGQPVIIEVEIVNDSSRDILIVVPQDGSEQKFRFPKCFFEVKKEDGAVLKDTAIACKVTDPLNRDGFARVKAGGKLRFYRQGFDLGTFKYFAAGRYSVRFYYSTAAQKDWQWYGPYSDQYWRERMNNEFWSKRAAEDGIVSRLLKKVPPLELVSNEAFFSITDRAVVSREEALKTAKEVCEQQGWAWEDEHIADNKDFWDITTRWKTLGGNIFIRIDKRTGKVLEKHVTGP